MVGEHKSDRVKQTKNSFSLSLHSKLLFVNSYFDKLVLCLSWLQWQTFLPIVLFLMQQQGNTNHVKYRREETTYRKIPQCFPIHSSAVSVNISGYRQLTGKGSHWAMALVIWIWFESDFPTCNHRFEHFADTLTIGSIHLPSNRL